MVKIATRTILLIFVTMYLVSIGFLLSAIDLDNSIDQPLNVTSDDKTISSYDFNLVTNIGVLPLWVNTIFIFIPLAFWVFLFITAIVPTVNAGA